MIKVALNVVRWLDNVDIGGGVFGKSLTVADKGVAAIWFLGNGVLVERKGKADLFVPVTSVQSMEAPESVTPEQWGGGGVAAHAWADPAEGRPAKTAAVFMPEHALAEAPKKNAKGKVK